MPLLIIRADITTLQVDAIVNAANESLLGGGGVDGAIHRAAGPLLLEACRRLHGCKTGKAKITKGYQLPAKYVIHTVGPIWRGGDFGEEQLLVSAYESALHLAKKHHCQSVAFPLISSGAYGYPKAQALRVAERTIRAFLTGYEMTVYLVVFDKAAFRLSVQRFDEIEAFIDQTYVDAHTSRSQRLPAEFAPYEAAPAKEIAHPMQNAPAPGAGIPTLGAAIPKLKKRPSARADQPTATEDAAADAEAPVALACAPDSLESMLGQMDESFSELLLRKIDERGMKDSECYKKANVDRKLFSKIRSDPLYHPRKSTALAFAIALELSLPETQELLQHAGFALTHASKFDIIVEYFIRNKNYNIFEINEALFAFDQSLLGA